jgi:uncharacterized protein (TIGR00369 family)
LAETDFAAAVPFAGVLGMDVHVAEPDDVRGTLAWRAELCTAGGIMHGGALMGFADNLGGICAFLNLPPDATTATVESKTNFFRPVRDGTVTGRTRPLHVGRTFVVVQTELEDTEGRAVAQVTQTQAVIVRRGE